MDDIVKQAMTKWPNVPHCYGWLALDARGVWRMRDEAAQQADAPGDKLNNTALVGFINRNYLADERGCWYFQNGPQRVFMNLEATPFIARTDPAQGLVLHTGEALGSLEQAWLLDSGALLVRAGARVAQLDDRDVAQLLRFIELDDQPVRDEALMAWLGGGAGRLVLRWQEHAIEIERLVADEAPRRFGFVRRPDRLAQPQAGQ
ncbi:DUF2946 family protein [Massilia sp. 9096]|uniref:DUF2946 family protein n=1 Tax=Massilia sp. 9096 TaxID=1500894 RepID=UPI00056AD2BF|nr:DUF2946 family protein [Massilia sp. 9096]